MTSLQSWCRRTLVVPGLVAVCFVAGTARGSSWDRVAHPERARANALVVLVERSRVPREDRFFRPEDHALLSKRAAMMMKIAGAAEMRDENLQYLYADALFEAGEGFEVEAEVELHRALDWFPESPHAAAAWAKLAALASERDDASGATAALTRSLDSTWHVQLRAQLRLHRAEEYMLANDVAKALDDFRAVMDPGIDTEFSTRAKWGAAVALERAFDLPSALRLAREAASVRFGNGNDAVNVLDLPGATVHPSYDEHYYRALAMQAEASAESDPEVAVEKLQTAAFLWSLYVTEALQKHRPPWLENARRHRASCTARIEELAPDADPEAGEP